MQKWVDNIFNLTHDYKINDHGKIWVGAKFDSCWYCGKGDITFLICYMTSCEHVIKSHVTSCVGSPYHKLLPCQVWWL